jgi:hypothetical protein
MRATFSLLYNHCEFYNYSFRIANQPKGSQHPTKPETTTTSESPIKETNQNIVTVANSATNTAKNTDSRVLNKENNNPKTETTLDEETSRAGNPTKPLTTKQENTQCGFCTEAKFETVADLKNHLYKDHIELIVSTLVAASANNNQPKNSTANMESFCNICKKEVCNKYFLKSHLLNKHGVQLDDYLAAQQQLNSGPNSQAAAALVAAAVANELIENHTQGLSMNTLNQVVAAKLMSNNSHIYQSALNGHKSANVRPNLHNGVNVSARSGSPMSLAAVLSGTHGNKHPQPHHTQHLNTHHTSNHHHNSSYNDGYIEDESEEYTHGHQYGSNVSRASNGHHFGGATGPYANSENDETDEMDVSNANESSSGQANASSNSNTELFNHYLKLAVQQQQQQNGNGSIPQQQPGLDMFSSGHQMNGSVSNGATEDFCDICQKQFCNKYYLKKHKQDVHGVSGPQDAANAANSNQTPKNIKRILNELAGASSQKNNSSKGRF